MRLLSITLYRFASFVEETTFDFPDGPGLFFLRGENRSEPALEANGAGKSTLWNAISWAIFDRTVKGLRAGDVANWEQPKGACVKLRYTDGVAVCSVTRQHSPNKWVWQVDEYDGIHDEEPVDLTKDSTNPVLNDLRLQLEPFMNCVLMGQGRPMFIDLSPTKKAELFSDVLGLDVWLERSKKASKRADDQDTVSRDLERRLASVTGQLQGIDHSALDGSAADWKAEKDARYERVMRRYEEALSERKRIKRRADDLRKDVDAAREFLRERVADLEGVRKELDELSAQHHERKARADEGERWLNEKTDERQVFLKLTQCPTCRQAVSREHRDSVGDTLQATLTSKAKAQLVLWAHEAEARDALQALKNGMPEFAAAVEEARKKLDTIDQDFRQAQNGVAYLDKDLDRLEDDAERISAERNPFASMKQEALDREENLQAQRGDLQRQLDGSVARCFLLSSWAKWFKELRLKLINDSLEELEIEVNSNVEELGLHGWALRFEVDKETKSGSISRGFNVLVQSPHNERAVPWEAWSGGEGQRLRIATQEGLADLIRSRTGATINLEVWDEPTEHLSGQGVNDLLDALAGRARREQRQVWVVDHRSLGYGAFTDVYTVVKDADGSHFEHT